MSRVYVVYSLKEIDIDFFDRTLEEVRGRIVEVDSGGFVDEDTVREGYLGEGAADGTNVYLCRDPMSELYDDENQDLFRALGGKPLTRIELNPGKGKNADTFLVDYLGKLADSLDYVVTNFGGVLMTGKEVQEKRQLGWTTLEAVR